MDPLRLVESIWTTAAQMSPYLLFGLVVAGVLHVLVPARVIRRHLEGKGWGPIFKAALAGVPLPLCSCGVIPVAEHLRREGAGRGATLSFLASTPSTGVDSILATSGLLGPVFAVLRMAYAFVAGLLAGVLTERFGTPLPAAAPGTVGCAPAEPTQLTGFVAKARAGLKHGFEDVLLGMRGWLWIGIVAGGVLSWALPEDLFAGALGNPVLSYLAMAAIGVPLYVCATGSLPIAAALLAKGLSPGAALVFLAVGPATNTATIGFVAKSFGRRTLAIYLGSLVGVAFAFGAAIDLTGLQAIIRQAVACHVEIAWWEHASAVLLLALSLRHLPPVRLSFRKSPHSKTGSVMKLSIPSISCGNCVRHVRAALEAIPGIADVSVDQEAKTASFSGVEIGVAVEALGKAGYPAIAVE